MESAFGSLASASAAAAAAMAASGIVHQSPRPLRSNGLFPGGEDLSELMKGDLVR